jgi:hypothetical protein
VDNAVDGVTGCEAMGVAADGAGLG